MKNKILVSVLSMLLLSIISPNVFSQETVIRVAPRPLLKFEDPQIMDIVIENGQNVAGYQVMLQFDSNHVDFSDIDYGDYLPSGSFFGEPQIIDTNPNDSLKAVRFAATAITGESNGDGVLATLTFDSISSTESDLILLADATSLSNRAGILSVPHLEHSKTFPSAVADLVVSSVQAIPTNAPDEERNYFEKGETFELRATVRNRGTWASATTPQAQLIFYGHTDTETEKGDALGDGISIGHLERNAVIEVSLPNAVQAPITSGVYYYTVCIDDNVIGANGEDEVVTDNNCFTLKIEVDPSDLVEDKVTAGEIKPDLVVELVRVSKDLLAPAEQFKLTATIKNQGTELAIPIYYRWYRSTTGTIGATEEEGETDKAVYYSPEVESYTDYALLANQSYNQSIYLRAPKEPGTHYYHVCVGSVETALNCSSDVISITVLDDLTGDGIINEYDFLIVVAQFGLNRAPATKGNTIDHITDPIVREIYTDYLSDGYIEEKNVSIAVKKHADLNADGTVDFEDIEIMAKALDAVGVFAAPNIARLTPDTVKKWMIEAKQLWKNDPTFAALEQFDMLLPPMATALLSNYPNPFNPETWIPYHLAKPADVRLTIYDINGHIVRALDVGHRRAGRYQDRAHAAHWDGKNTHGEPVASGIYFYTLTAGDFTATRRMLIRK